MLVYSSLLSCLLLLRVLRFSVCLSLYWCCIHIHIICTYLGHYVTAHSHTHRQVYIRVYLRIYQYTCTLCLLYSTRQFILMGRYNMQWQQELGKFKTYAQQLLRYILQWFIERAALQVILVPSSSLTFSIRLLAYLNPRNRIVNTFKVLKVDKVTRIFYHLWGLSQSALYVH